MKNINLLLLAILLLVCRSSFALDCAGKVTHILEWSTQCSGQFAYILDNSNGKYFCAKTQATGSLVVSALMANKTSQVRVITNDATCETLSSHYLTPTYINLYKD